MTSQSGPSSPPAASPVNAPQETSAAESPGGRSDWCWLGLICALFVLLRAPVAWRQVPAQDEDYFAVPGYTILREGIPRIPYLPARDPVSCFYRADERLLMMPPLYFYWQGAVYAVIGPGTGAARLAAMAWGVVSIIALYWLARRLELPRSSGLWVAGLFAGSRVLYFPAMVARPDTLCAGMGHLSLLSLIAWETTRRRRWLTAAGGAIGAGLLTHPFAIVFVFQAVLWCLWGRGEWRARLVNLVQIGAAAAVVFSLWLILILPRPDLFEHQFVPAVLNQSGPGLVGRLFWPLPSLAAQATLFWEHNGPLQSLLLLAGLPIAVLLTTRSTLPGGRTLLFLIVTALYFHIACQGAHPTKGYWCYTGGLLLLGVAAGIGQLERHSRRPLALRTACLVLALACLVPGSGLRALATHLRHWDDLNYNAPRFTQHLLELTPASGRQVIDPQFIFDFHRAGRDTVLALNYPFFFDVSREPYDLLIGGYTSLRDGVPDALEARFVRGVGNPDDLFACYAEIYSAPPHRRAIPEPAP